MDAIYTDQNYLDFISESAKYYYFHIPSFTDDQRKEYFDLSQDEYAYFKTLSNHSSKLYYVLLSGYFNSSMIISNLNKIHVSDADIQFIKDRFQLKTTSYAISSATIAKHKAKVCSLSGLCQYRSNEHRKLLLKKANELAKLHISPIFIFTEIIQSLSTLGLTMPSYREFQIIISQTVRDEENRICKQLKNISDDLIEDINNLLKSDEKWNLASLILLPKNVSNKEIEAEITRLISIKKLYAFTVNFLPSLDLSIESVKYYSSLVKYYGRSKLVRMNTPLVKLYSICYVNHRFQRIHDNLIDSFLSLICRYYTEATNQAATMLSEAKKVYDMHETKLASILGFYNTTDKNDIVFAKVRKEAFKLVPNTTLKKVVSYMNSKEHRKNKTIWELLGKSQKRFKKNLRRIFLHIDIQSNDINLMQACSFIKQRIEIKKYDDIPYKSYPKQIIPDKLKAIIVYKKDNKQHIDFGQYEFLVYWILSDYIGSGDASISDSVIYKSFEEDQLPKDIIDSPDFKLLDLPFFTTPIKEHLADLRLELEDNIKESNKNIELGCNYSLSIKDWDKRKWTLPYNKQNIETNDPLFEKLKHINIVDVMRFVHGKIRYLNTFTHILPKNIQRKDQLEPLLASLIAKATNHGIYRMSKISDMTYETLKQCSISMISMENVMAACNVLSNEIKKQPIFKYYDINDILHGAIDGQKYKVKKECSKAKSSAKYHHLGKSVSSGTLLINHVPANAKLFGSNEHESRFIFDLVYNNKTEIQPQTISTDSAGSNFVNFALLKLIGREFAPCFKRINNKATMFAGFDKPSKYKHYFLRPSSQIKEQLIIDEWDNIKRIMASLVLKNTTQSILVRKLCGTARKDKTKEALWEYDKIIRSNYLFRYIDNEDLRTSVRTALNRTEAFHQLKKSIASVNSDSLTGGDDDDIALNDQCTRLLCLVVYSGEFFRTAFSQKIDVKLSKTLSILTLPKYTSEGVL